jgi:hypothetical protein
MPRFLRQISEKVSSAGKKTCPAICELDNGDYLVIGKLANQETLKSLPDSVPVADDELVIIIPRITLVSTKPNVP